MTKISIPDVREIAAYGLGGLLLFSGFAIANLFSRKKIGDSLCVQTKTLHRDETLRALLFEVQNETKDQVEFMRCLATIDRITTCYNHLLTKPAQVDLNTRKSSTADFDLIQEAHFARIFNGYSEHHPGKNGADRVVDFQQLLERVAKHVHIYVTNIYLLTENIPQNPV